MRRAAQISVTEATRLVKSGDTILVGGFGMTGHPVHLLHALAETDVRNLTFVGNNLGEPGLGGGRLLRNGQVKKAIGSFFTSNKEAVQAAQAGKLEVQLMPQGTLAEAMRAGGAGLGGFFTPAAAGTDLAKGLETRVIDGTEMVLIAPIRGDVALIRAWKADTAGNLQYRRTENNFNQAAATAARLVIAEVEEIVPVGELDPNSVHTPACLVDYIVQATLRKEDLGSSASLATDKTVDESRMQMARAALAELRSGQVVNLGIGIPTLVADLITPAHGVTLHTENGMLGVGPEPDAGGAMEYPVNAGKLPVTELPGASYFDSSISFGLIRGGHIDVAIMGGLQVDQDGNLANWAVHGGAVLGVGGAMDLASGARKLIVTMTHTDKSGASKVLENCTLPLTTRSNVKVLITDLAVFRFGSDGMSLVRLMPGKTLEQVAAATTARYKVRLEPARAA